MSSVNLFNTGKSGLFASRSNLATTGHNISNVNTEGYSRQRVEQVTNEPQQLGGNVYGTGTRVKQIHRINDEFVTRQIATEGKLMGQFEEKDMALSQAETVFNETTSEGMNRLMSKFFNELRKLGNEPESEALRSTTRESAEQLCGDFHRVSTSLRDIQKNVDIRLEANVRQANELVQRIAKLNHEIKLYESRGGQPGDLQDARDQAVKKLSEIVDVNMSTNEKGELTIAIANCGPLVSGTLFNKIYLKSAKSNPETGAPEGSMQVYLENLASPNITPRLKNSRMGGLVEARDQYLGSAVRRVDELAFTFASKINEVHRQGFSISGKTGLDFFQAPDKIDGAAAEIKVGREIHENANNIATALIADAPGDNRLIQFMTRLQHMRLMSGGNSTFDDHYNATVADLATISSKNKQYMDHQAHIVGQLQKLRESISGVSLDEETTNLVQFQHAFDASAKVIKVADEMLETVLNLRR